MAIEVSCFRRVNTKLSGLTEKVQNQMPSSNRKQRTGLAAKDAHQKTVVVVVERRQAHPLYKKTVSRSSRYMAHDEENTCKAGDTVLIEETRPLSKNKRWRVIRVVERARHR